MPLYKNETVSWEQYLSLEQNFLEYLRSVPLEKKHNEVWSYQLGNLIIDIGSVIDSFLRNSIYLQSLDSVPGIQEIRSKEKKKGLSIGDYHKIYYKHYKLSSKSVYELRNYNKINPFYRWKSNPPPFWWTAYNKVKHNRFENRKRATLKSTLYALSALFLLNVTNPKLVPYLVDIGVIHRMGWAEEYVKSHIVDGSIVDVKPAMHEPIHAKTELFGYIYPNKCSKFDEAEQKRILSPLNRGSFGSWNR